jgi:hypothetical protein
MRMQASLIFIGYIVAERPDIRNPPSATIRFPSLRAQRSNPSRHKKKEWIASSLCSSQ